MNLLHLYAPWETETGSAGEQPVKGYLGQAHQTMTGRGVYWASRPPRKTSSDDRPAMPQKTHPKHCGLVPQIGVQETGRGTR